MNKLTRSLIIAGIVSIPAVAMADGTAPAAAPSAPTLTDVLGASGVSLTGYVDAGYTSMNSSGLFTNGGATRVFDAPNATAGKNFSSFSLNQVGVTVAKQPASGFGGLANFTGGEDANVIASYGAGNNVAGNGGNMYNNNHNFDITQAYGSYASGPATVILGKFVTLAGAEVINSTANTNYSRSILFGYAIPFTHTGARLTYAASDTVSLIAGINNGWDQVADQNTGKTVELGVTAAPSKMFSFAGSFYGGKELAAPGGLAAGSSPYTPGVALPALSQLSNGNRQLVDLVGTVNATDSLSFVVNYDNGSQQNAVLQTGSLGTAKWDGTALYANYMFSEMWRLSFRTEYLNDKNGFRTGIAQKWKENTLTLAFMPAKSFEFRGEVRGDTSNVAAFQRGDGTAASSQTSVGLEAIYKF